MAALRAMQQQGGGEQGALALVALTLRCMLLASGREAARKPRARLREWELRALVAMAARAATATATATATAEPPPPPQPQETSSSSGGSGGGGVLQEARRSLLGALGLSFGSSSSSSPAPAVTAAPAPAPAPAVEEVEDDEEEEEEDDDEADDDVDDDLERPFPRRLAGRKKRGQRRRGAQPPALCCGQQVVALASLAAWALQTHSTLREALAVLGLSLGRRLEPRAWFDGPSLAAALRCPRHPSREVVVGTEEGKQEGAKGRLRALLWAAATDGVDLGACLAPADADEEEEVVHEEEAPEAVAEEEEEEEEDLTTRLKRQLGMGLGIGMGMRGPAAATAAQQDEDEGEDMVLLRPLAGGPPGVFALAPPSLPHRYRVESDAPPRCPSSSFPSYSHTHLTSPHRSIHPPTHPQGGRPCPCTRRWTSRTPWPRPPPRSRAPC
jgi:hypothetical protein